MDDNLGFNIDINHDELYVALVIVAGMPNAIRSQEDMQGFLDESNVLHGIEEDEIERAFEALKEAEEPGQRFVIARGMLPNHGKNGQLDFKVDVSGKAQYFKEGEGDKEEGKIDYRNAITYTAVTVGEILAEIIPPTEGVSGINLAGKEIPARNGKMPPFRTGEGAEIAEDGLHIVATQEGRPIFAHNQLTVSPILIVAEDVDFSTGNIQFKGHVAVKGSVQDGFSVEANSIAVEGTVGASNIKCKGLLEIAGGINGRERAEIVCMGAAVIKYVNQAKIEVRGDLDVNREIVNSRVWCRGKVAAGKIIGGECLALLGIEAKLIGSELGVATLLEPGANYEIRRIENAMEVLGEHIGATIKPVNSFFGDRQRYKALPEEKKAEFQKAFEQFKRLKAGHDKLSRARVKLLQTEELKPIKEVLVWKMLFADVLVRTDKCVRQFRKPATGPLALLEDVETGTMKDASHHDAKGIIKHGKSGAGAAEEANRRR